MKFKAIRESALKMWMDGTKRIREDETDSFGESYECSWQNEFKDPDEYDCDHKSIFCSLGEWNSIITDYLTDIRWDDLEMDNKENDDQIFRQYVKVLLAVSEILTDFQDMLSTFRHGEIRKYFDQDNTISRTILDTYNTPGTIQNLFNYINNVCKHKSANIHRCNHHLSIHFDDSGELNEEGDSIQLNNIMDFVGKNPNRVAKRIVMPKLEWIIEVLLKGYIIVDENFKADNAKFGQYCDLYKEVGTE